MTTGDPELRIDEVANGPAATLYVRGELCTATRARLASAVDHCLRQGVRVLRIDLRDAFADSSGFASLLDACSACRTAGVTLELASPPSTRRILTTLGFPRRFRIGSDAVTVRVLPPPED